jgi:hypothetical protein
MLFTDPAPQSLNIYRKKNCIGVSDLAFVSRLYE